MRLRKYIPVILTLLCLATGMLVSAQNAKRPGEKHVKKEEQTDKTDVQTTESEPVLSRKERKRLHREEKRKLKEEKRAEKEKKEKGKNKAQESKPKSYARPLPGISKEPVLPKRRKQDVLYPPSRIKPSYRIDILIPLYLDELVKGESVTFKDKVPEKAVAGIGFYQGIKLAADSLKKAGHKLDIYIHDAASFSESGEMLIINRKLDSTDLIIGAVQQHDIPELAGFARKKRINFVSALSPNDGYVKGNQYFTMLQPTLKSHCEYIIDDMSKKYPGEKVALLYRTTNPNDENAGQYMATDNYKEVEFKKLLCNALPGRQSLLSVLDTSKPNIIVAPVLDAGFADSLLKSLSRYFPGTHFEVYGMPTWNAIANLRKPNAYPNITVNITYPFDFEPTEGNMVSVVDMAYKKEYSGKASEMVYRGYEALFWYAALLKQYGTLFNTNYKDNSGAPFTKFEVKPRWDANGSLLFNENRNIYLSTYQAGVYKTE